MEEMIPISERPLHTQLASNYNANWKHSTLIAIAQSRQPNVPPDATCTNTTEGVLQVPSILFELLLEIATCARFGLALTNDPREAELHRALDMIPGFATTDSQTGERHGLNGVEAAREMVARLNGRWPT